VRLHKQAGAAPPWKGRATRWVYVVLKSDQPARSARIFLNALTTAAPSTKRKTAKVSEADKMADIPGTIFQAHKRQLAVL